MKFELSQSQASLAVLIAAALWGIYWVPIRALEGAGLDGPMAVALLNGPAALVTGAWMWRSWPAQAPHLRDALAIGVLAGGGFALYGLAIANTSVIRATLLFYLMPVWATFIGIFWLGEIARWTRWTAVALGLGGLGLLLVGDPQASMNLGDLLAFLSGWSWAFAAAMIKRAGQIPISGMLTVQFICAAGFALLVGQLFGPVGLPKGAETVWPVIWAVLLAVTIVFPAVVMIFWASQFLFPGRVGLLLMAEVVVAVITASLLLPEEVLAPLQWGAVILIIAAALVELLPERKPKSGAEPL